MNSISNHHSKATLVKKKTEAGLHTEAVQKDPELSTVLHGGTRHGGKGSAGTNNVMLFSFTNLLQSNPRENKFWRQKHKIKLMISKLGEIQQKEVVALLWEILWLYLNFRCTYRRSSSQSWGYGQRDILPVARGGSWWEGCYTWCLRAKIWKPKSAWGFH